MNSHACLLTRNYYLITEIDFKIKMIKHDYNSQYTTIVHSREMGEL